MDLEYPSETDPTPSLESTLLKRITEFIGESGSREQYEAFLVWRSLSRSNQAIAEGAAQAQKTAEFAGFHNLTDAAAQHLAQCPQLQAVDFAGCRNLTDAAAQHLAQCPQLQTVYFAGCENLTDAATQHRFTVMM